MCGKLSHLIHRVDCKSRFLLNVSVSGSVGSLWGVSLVQLAFYNTPTHFLSRPPAVNKLHMVVRARLAAPRAARSASQLTIGQTLLGDFIRSLLQGVLAFDSAKRKKRKKISEEAPGQILHTHSILLQAWQLRSLSEAGFGCRVRE